MPTPAPGGYSGTPLAAKLGINVGSRVRVIGAPDGYERWLAPLPADVRFEPRLSTRTDLVHLFVTGRQELKRTLGLLRTRIRADAAIWVSWPKKTAKVPTDVTEDVIRAEALPLGFVDVKVCAVSEVWSGLRLVVRRELR
jgi:hypothetical protein